MESTQINTVDGLILSNFNNCCTALFSETVATWRQKTNPNNPFNSEDYIENKTYFCIASMYSAFHLAAPPSIARTGKQAPLFFRRQRSSCRVILTRL